MLAVLSMLKWTVAAAGLSGLAVGAFLGLSHPQFNDTRFRAVALEDGARLQVMTREVTKREWKACAEAEACDEFLKKDGLIVRRVASYGLPHCLRITVGDEPSCRRVAHMIGLFKAGASA